MEIKAKKSLSSQPAKDWKRTLSDICRMVGLPILYIGVLLLAGGFFAGYTPNWILASGLALVIIGAVGYFYSLR